jgi:hypothetical protein
MIEEDVEEVVVEIVGLAIDITILVAGLIDISFS